MALVSPAAARRASLPVYSFSAWASALSTDARKPGISFSHRRSVESSMPTDPAAATRVQPTLSAFRISSRTLSL